MSDYRTVINWYPGHMAKARRLLQEQLKRTDLIIEMCDARLPFTSRNPDLNSISAGKRRIVFLNKSDLADPDISGTWINYFRRTGNEAYLTDAARISGKETIGIIEKATKQMVDRSLERGIRKTVRAVVVGIPNVGKSTLINRLYGRSITRIGDRPGVTRANQWVKVSSYLEVLDTPGLLWPRLGSEEAARRLCYIGSVKDDVVDLTDLTIHLLEELCELVPGLVAERLHLRDPGLKGIELLEAVCEGRGWLLKGARYDYDRCCNVVLDEFRAGKLGRITFEKPVIAEQGVILND